MFGEKELKKQETTIKKYILFGFIPTILLIIVLFFFQTNSLEYNKKEYLKKFKLEIKGKVIFKYQENNNLRANRYIILNTKQQEFVTKEEYNQISIGDSVKKEKNNDSIYFVLRNNKVIKRDYTIFFRTKYLELKEN